MSTLFIELNPLEASVLSRWWLCENGNVTASGADLLDEIEVKANAADTVPGKRDMVVLLPDRDVFYMCIEVPGKSRARVRQATPFAVEPLLTEDIEDVHIAVGDFARGEKVPCMVINRSTLDMYVSRIESAGLRPTVISTPGMLVSNEAELSLIEVQGGVTVRTSEQSAVVALESLAVALANVPGLESGEITKEVNCFGSESFVQRVRESMPATESAEYIFSNASFEALLSTIDEPKDLLNLLQGEFAQIEASDRYRQFLNQTAATAASCVLLVAGLFVAQGMWANYQTNLLHEAALDVYESVYNTRNVSGNPVFRMQERLGSNTVRQSSWLSLLEGVANSTKGVEIRNLDFNDAQSKMTITFYVDSFQEFEAIRTRIESAGLSVDVNVAEQQNDRVWARLSLASS